MWKYLLAGLCIYFLAVNAGAQELNCTFKEPVVTINFGSGVIPDVNMGYLFNYERVSFPCPPDGYYCYAHATSNCFGGDWHTLLEDHTAGDGNGNMLLVNGAPDPGIFLKTTINGLKGGTIYEFGVWLMNLCIPSDKCPYPLLPNITVRMETPDGKRIAEFVTGDLIRSPEPRWKMHRAVFSTPASLPSLNLVMIDNAPGGCGNDFAVDDITFRECIKTIPPKSSSTLIKTVTPATNKPTASTKPALKKNILPPQIKTAKASQVLGTRNDSAIHSISVIKEKGAILSSLPLVLTTRENSLVKRIETEAGEIKIQLYDNGEIDGDTVSIYHNNVLVKSHAGLSDKPITFTIPIDASQPHHEVIMVAENLGSIPPNTSLMVITAGNNRYEVFISSNEQKNAKVIFDLRK
jgi:hypothetical protein